MCNVTGCATAKTGEYPSNIPQFSKPRVMRKKFEELKTASIWGENMLTYLALDITFSSKLTVFQGRSSRKTERMMSADKYPSIFR